MNTTGYIHIEFVGEGISCDTRIQGLNPITRLHLVGALIETIQMDESDLQAYAFAQKLGILGDSERQEREEAEYDDEG